MPPGRATLVFRAAQPRMIVWRWSDLTVGEARTHGHEIDAGTTSSNAQGRRVGKRSRLPRRWQARPRMMKAVAAACTGAISTARET
jgi:hypothetical protein